MMTPRPRPVPPGSASPKGPQQKAPKGSLRSGAVEAMREHALRRAAQHTDFSYKYADTNTPAPPPFAGFGWEEVRNDDQTASSGEQGEFVPR